MSVTKEQIDEAIVAAMEWSYRQAAATPADLVIVALADEVRRWQDEAADRLGQVAALADQRAELVALLSWWVDHAGDAFPIHANKARALLARIGVTP